MGNCSEEVFCSRGNNGRMQYFYCSSFCARSPTRRDKRACFYLLCGDVPSDLQQSTTIDTIIQQLDPYSTYFSREEFEEYTNSINNTTTGIGVVIEENEQGNLDENTFEVERQVLQVSKLVILFFQLMES